MKAAQANRVLGKNRIAHVMVWKYINGNKYYYRARRVNGKVRYEYVAGVGIGELCERLDAELREEREEKRDAERQALEATKKAIAERDEPIRAYCRDVDQAVRETLEAHGYHRHNRGAWRRKRGQAMSKPGEMVVQVQRTELPAELNRLAGLLAGIVAASTNMAEAEQANMTRDTMKIYRELAGDDPTPIERVLAERAAVCWAAAYAADWHALAAHWSQYAPKVIERLDRQRSRANNRFLAAVKTLAAVRKLDLPSVVVNATGPTQVNVGEHRR